MSARASSKAAKASKPPPRILAVRASAGAGKTYQLTIRFLQLLQLLKGVPPSGGPLRQIVAITFTNRAAAEMKDRVILALKEIALKTDDGRRLAAETGLAPAEAAAWLETILDNFSDFQVRTIDSLIHAVMRAFAIEIGLPPELEIDFDKDAMLNRCFDTLLASIAWDNPKDRNRALILALVDAYLHIDEAAGMSIEGRVRERLFKLYDKACESDRDPVDPNYAGVKKRLETASQELLSAMEACGFTACFPGNQRIGDYLRAPARNLDKAFWGKASLAAIGSKAAKFNARDLSSLERRFADLKEIAGEFVNAHPRARIFPYLQVLAELRKEVKAQPQNEGVLLGGTWLERVYEGLRKHDISGSYAFLKLGSAIRHFLIDEFQDTSHAQWRMLTELVRESLASGGTLFYVGDVKQAIYGWRGGDWRLFGNVLLEDSLPVERERRDQRVLDTNYRSLAAVVGFNNTLYSSLLDPQRGRVLAEYMMPGEAPPAACAELAATLSENFHDVVQERKSAEDERYEGHVCVVTLVGNKEELEAQIEEWLRHQVKEAWQRREGREPRQQGIAVLVRSNEQAEQVANWLVAEGVPIVTENSLRLRSSPLIKGMVSLLHFLEYPLDNMAFWGAAASPLFAGLPEFDAPADLGGFLRSARGSGLLYKAFERAFPAAAQRLIRPLMARSGFLAPYDLVREVLEVFDAERRFPGEAVFIHRLLEIVFQAETRRSMSLSGFLQFWDQTGAEEQVGLPEDLRAVRILTIHKAKGLEFPVVFVPFTNWKRWPDTVAFTPCGDLVWLEGSRGVPLPDELKEMKWRTTMENVIESLNVLYVATTRPREELYLYVTCLTSRDRPNRQYLSAWLQQMLDEVHLDAIDARDAGEAGGAGDAREAPDAKDDGSAKRRGKG